MIAAQNGHDKVVKLLHAAYKAQVGLTYKHSDQYVLYQLKAIDSKPQDAKTQFKDTLLVALKDDSFAIYRLYNITAHTKNEVNLDTNMTDRASNDLKDLIHQELQSKYNELSSIETFFYAILHFFEEYVIFPIWGDHEGTLAMGHGTDSAPSDLQ